MCFSGFVHFWHPCENQASRFGFIVHLRNSSHLSTFWLQYRGFFLINNMETATASITCVDAGLLMSKANSLFKSDRIVVERVESPLSPMISKSDSSSPVSLSSTSTSEMPDYLLFESYKTGEWQFCIQNLSPVRGWKFCHNSLNSSALSDQFCLGQSKLWLILCTDKSNSVCMFTYFHADFVRKICSQMVKKWKLTK